MKEIVGKGSRNQDIFPKHGVTGNNDLTDKTEIASLGHIFRQKFQMRTINLSLAFLNIRHFFRNNLL